MLLPVSPLSLQPPRVTSPFDYLVSFGQYYVRFTHASPELDRASHQKSGETPVSCCCAPAWTLRATCKGNAVEDADTAGQPLFGSPWDGLG